jgi:hypothetical protein
MSRAETRGAKTTETPAASECSSPPIRPKLCAVELSSSSRSPSPGMPGIAANRSTSAASDRAVLPITFGRPVEPELNWTSRCPVVAGRPVPRHSVTTSYSGRKPNVAWTLEPARTMNCGRQEAQSASTSAGLSRKSKSVTWAPSRHSASSTSIWVKLGGVRRPTVVPGPMPYPANTAACLMTRSLNAPRVTLY